MARRSPKAPATLFRTLEPAGRQCWECNGFMWTTYHNQPTAQFYRVTTDNAFPYRIYAAQQDNSTIRIAHRTTGFSIGERDWEETAGGESGISRWTRSIMTSFTAVRMMVI